MRTVTLIGGPMCGAMICAYDEQQEYRVAMLPHSGAWVREHPALKHRIGVYAPRDYSDAVLGRWTWKEPT